jgi:hypothetical protein
MTNESDVQIFPNSRLYLLTCLIYSTESTSLKVYICGQNITSLDTFLPLITIIKECLFSSYIFVYLMNHICCMRSAHYKSTPLLLCITDLKVFCWKGDCWWPTLFMFLNLYFQSCSAGLEKFSSIQTTKN